MKVNFLFCFFWQVFTELNQITDENISGPKINEYKTKIDELRDKQLMYEMQLVDQLEVRSEFRLIF